MEGYLAVSLIAHGRLRLSLTLADVEVALDMDALAARLLASALEFSDKRFPGSLPCTEDGAVRWRVDGSVQVLGAELHETGEVECGPAIELRCRGPAGELERRLNTSWEAFGLLHPGEGCDPGPYGLARPGAVVAGTELEGWFDPIRADRLGRALRDADDRACGTTAGGGGVLEAPAVELGDEDRAAGVLPSAGVEAHLEAGGEDAGPRRGPVVEGFGRVAGDRHGRAGGESDVEEHRSSVGGVRAPTVGRPAAAVLRSDGGGGDMRPQAQAAPG